MGTIKCQNYSVCGNTIDEKYKFCQKCYNDYKEKQSTPDPNSAVVRQLQKNNNNLYAIKRLLTAILEDSTGNTIAWNKQLKDFEIIPLKD